MLKLSKESLKTFLLLFLMTLSLVLIGVHWNQQAQGFPFQSFLNIIFNQDRKVQEMDVSTVKSTYFTPESVIVSISPTASLWKLEKNDPYYKNIWNDVKDNYIPSIIKQKPNKVIAKEQWETIISERCIRIDLTVNWPNDVIFWLEDTYSGDFKAFNSIKSIAILPQKDVNQSVNTVYIYDETQVYQYQVSIKEGFLPKSFYSGLEEKLDSLKRPVLYELTNKYSIFESSKDILISLSNEWSNTYSTVKIDIPSSIVLNRANIDSQSVQDNILLDQKESLMDAKYNEEKGQALFTDVNDNVFEYYENGILEYRYLSNKKTDPGSASSAFSQALSFIQPRKKLIDDAELVLTYIKPIDNYYEMHFNYSYDGIPVYYSGSGLDEGISSPLIIKANSERVLECRWVIRSISKIDQAKKYNLYFYNLIEKQIPDLYPEIVDKENRDVLYFERIEPAYVFGLNDQGGSSVAPEWVISTDTKDYYIPIMAKEE